MLFSDSFSLAFRTVRSNKLRTGITVTIIALGITALIGIITATASMDQSLRENFSTMGANSFSIRYQDQNIQFGRRQVKKESLNSLKAKKSDNGKIITYNQARLFKENYAFPASVSISINGPQNVIVTNGLVNTNPNVAMTGVDENYLGQNGYTLSGGR